MIREHVPSHYQKNLINCMIFIFFSLSPHASSWELLEDLWLRSSRDCLLLVAENASSSDNISFLRNSSHLCFTSLLSILTSCTTFAIPHRLGWSCQQIHQRLRICSVVIILLPCWRSLISLILSWFVEIISNTCLIKSSKARLYVPGRFRVTMMSRI